VTGLRAVGPGEVAPKLPPKSITEAADSGTTRELLVSMRTRIAQAVENQNTPARDLAALSKRLIEVVRDIEAIDARAEQEAGKRGLVGDGRFDAEAI
jgi:hypothetical protein